MRNVAVQKAKKAAKSAAAFTKKAVQAVAKAASTIINALAGLAGGGVLLVALLVVALIAAIVSSSFGIFFAGNDDGSVPDAVSAAEAVASINSAFNARLAELQAEAHDSVQINGHMADWGEVLAVFAVQTAGNDAGVDVATLDADRLARLTAVFWAMNAVTGQVTPVNHPDSDPNPGVTGVLSIANGGTDAATSAAARNALGAQSKIAYGKPKTRYGAPGEPRKAL